MHRFRKKSDAKRGQGQISQGHSVTPHFSERHTVPRSPNQAQQLPEQQPPSSPQHPAPTQSTAASLSTDYLPSIPPSDFRASVILPEFSNQFPVLRSENPITIADLKSRFADQRARGAAHSITEEEEDMLLDALRFRPRGSSNNVRQSKETLVSESQDNQSNVTASSSSNRSKRYSNNLFGSGKLRDYTYMKNASSERSKVSSTSSSSIHTSSVTPTESSIAAGRVNSLTESTSAPSLRPPTPEGATSISSIVSSSQGSSTSSQQGAGNVVAWGMNVPRVEQTTEQSFTSSSDAVPTATAIEYRLAKTMDPATFPRALQHTFHESDETDDEIVLPRSNTPRIFVNDEDDARNISSSFEAGLAVSADKQVVSPSDEQRASPLPSRVIPGYIPGMNRPMTPRDYELDDRSHSTTPRATSPIMNVHNDSKSSSSIPGASGLGRKESISAATVRQSPRSNTPSLFLQRSPSANGRYTPEESLRRGGSGDVIELESPSHSSLFIRRRPTSPLSNLAASGSATSSRPSTPSNVVWQPSLSGSMSPTKSTHTKNDSWASETSASEMILATTRYVHQPQRSIGSPPLPDSPPALQPNFPILGHTRRATPPPDRAQSLTNANGNDASSSNRSQRSPTPTQNAPRSPSSPGFGMDRNGGNRRSSRQQTASPFNFSSAGYTAPMLNLFDNSSRTSIASMGSSYHSWEGDKDDMDWYDHILTGEESQTVWHDLNVGRTESPLSEEQAEELLKKYFGLTISDMGMIQEKLVGYASAKGGGSRKRKMSVSQSANAPVRVNCPPLQTAQAAVIPTSATASSSEQYSKKANALLDSIVHDIQAKHSPPPPPLLDTTNPTVSQAPPSNPSPGTQKNHSLAAVLFGHDTTPQRDPQSNEQEPASALSVDEMPNESKQEVVSTDESKPTAISSFQSETLAAPASASAPSSPSVSATQIPYSVSRNPSSARVNNSSKNQADIAREVQAKIAQADASIKSASKTNLPGDGLGHSGSISRKRIDPSQIGTPQLVSHSNPASLDAFQMIPSRSPTLSTNNNSGTSKIGSRFKKLRGSLRSKASPLTEDISSSTSTTSVNVKPLNSAQSVNYDPAKHAPPGNPTLRSATESASSKVTVLTPPASAGPTLKGFISRFRGKQRAAEPSPISQQRPTTQTSSAPLHTPVLPRQEVLKAPAEDVLKSPPPKRQSFQLNAPAPGPSAETLLTPSHAASPSTGSRQSVMIQQLFDAANNLGLDQNALNDLLVRSGSVSLRTPKLGRANSQAARSSSRTGQRSGTPTVIEQSNSGDTAQITLPITARPSQGTPEPNATNPVVTQPPEVMRRTREQRGDRTASAVVRRTIILPENIKVAGTDIQNVSQRPSSRQRRRSSANSGSLKDRAPTPPPPRSPVGSRFSGGNFPPVPSMPSSLSPEAYLSIPRINTEKPTSAYDPSIYEVYNSLGSRVQSTIGSDALNTDGTQNTIEPAPALEFIEYANGDTIWSIVSGLRTDEDDESIYNGRTSFSSEYSAGAQGSQDWDNMQVTVKEHARSSSRGSYSSFALKGKRQSGQSKSRPETKVFYSSTAQIGRLIENLSQGMDSGAFNFTPSPLRPGHSASSSLSANDLSMEEKLEQVLASLNRGS